MSIFMVYFQPVIVSAVALYVLVNPLYCFQMVGRPVVQ